VITQDEITPFNFDLRFNDKSPEVEKLQKKLKQLGFFPFSIPETGYYRETTQKAVRDFQYYFGVASLWELLLVNGKTFGLKSRNKMNTLLGGFKHRFWHLGEIRCIPGQHLKKGDLLGLTGTTGISTGAHLHYDLKAQDKWDRNIFQANGYFGAQDPLPFMKFDIFVNETH